VPETLIHLVRHGQVETPQRVLYGCLPGYHLSARGRQQAELLGRWFAGRAVLAVVSSPLERATETAAPIAASHGLEVEVDERLVEGGNMFEGVPGKLGWYILRHPRVWPSLLGPRTPRWGEPYADMAARMQAAVLAVRERLTAGARGARGGNDAGRAAVLVSHQAPIWVVRRAYAGQPLHHWPGRRQCALGSVTTLAFDGERLTGIGYAEPAAGPLRGVAPGRAGA
jgi:broad specificity phosphatase PhoE